MKLSFESLETRAMSSVNCLDPELRRLYSDGMRDGSINRTEMIGLFRNATDLNSITAAEMSDLRNIVAKSKMTGDVRDLAGDVLKGNPTASSMGFLVDKWFYGKDLPSLSGYSGVRYQQANGRLFVNGASSADIKQGMADDCYLIASIGALADKNNSSITSMFKDNMDGTWAVRFYRFERSRYIEDWVTVDRQLPVNSSGWTVFQGVGGHINDTRNELWAALAEKAYAQWDRGNSYAGLNRGWAHFPLSYITGASAYSTVDMKQTNTTLVSAVTNNQPVVIYRYMDSSRMRTHAYYVKSYFNGTFHLYNPWGNQHINLDMAGIRRECFGFAVATRTTTAPAVATSAVAATPMAPKVSPRVFAVLPRIS